MPKRANMNEDSRDIAKVLAVINNHSRPILLLEMLILCI